MSCMQSFLKRIDFFKKILSPKQIPVSIICAGCGQEFPPKRRTSKYCSINCFKENHIYDPEKYSHLSELRRNTIIKTKPHNYINRENWGQFNVGKERTEETKKILSDIAKVQWEKGQFREDVENRRKNIPRGEKHFNYKNGAGRLRQKLYSLFEYKQWRLDVFKRDNFSCKKCGVKGVIIEAHHIIPFREIHMKYGFKDHIEAAKCKELFDINNGVTLCIKCHSEEDSQRLRTIKKTS